nr:MAG: DNA pilot protein [Microvirus sp.]
MFDFAGDIFNAYSSHREAEMSRDFNELEAQKKREWDEKMANTQYQRTVQDLNAAGLSPMLAYSKGASALPSGATASSSATGRGTAFGETESRTSQSALAKAQVDVARSQEQLNIQTAKKVAEDAKASAINVEQMPTRFLYDLSLLGSQINANTANATKTNVDATNNLNLVTPGSDPYWYRDIKKNFSSGKQSIDSFIEGIYNKLRGPRK